MNYLNSLSESQIQSSLLAWPRTRDVLSSKKRIKNLPGQDAPFDKISRFFLDSINQRYLNEVLFLDLYNLGLKTVPPCINQFKGMRYLRLQDNELTCIPDFDLPNLTHLYLENNQLTFFSKIFKGCPSLEYLSLNKNRIKVITTDLQECANLRFLEVEENPLEEFDPNLSNCSKLTDLRLRFNKLKTFNISLKGCHNLGLIWLNGNELEVFSPDISECLNLSHLSLSHNKLRNFNQDLNLHTNLTLLHLENNQLNSFSQTCIANCKKLQFFST